MHLVYFNMPNLVFFLGYHMQGVFSNIVVYSLCPRSIAENEVKVATLAPKTAFNTRKLLILYLFRCHCFNMVT